MTSDGVSVRALVVSAPLATILLVACWHSNAPRCNGEGYVDLMTDRANCGACGHACPQSHSCFEGECRCNGIECAGVCTNLHDDLNCGSCGNVCPRPSTCVIGAFGYDCTPLPPTSCNGTPVDLMTARANCGACGNACELAAQCYSGTCVCYANVQTDKFNCGSCGNACPDPQKCIDGACR